MGEIAKADWTKRPREVLQTTVQREDETLGATIEGCQTGTRWLPRRCHLSSLCDKNEVLPVSPLEYPEKK